MVKKTKDDDNHSGLGQSAVDRVIRLIVLLDLVNNFDAEYFSSKHPKSDASTTIQTTY